MTLNCIIYVPLIIRVIWYSTSIKLLKVSYFLCLKIARTESFSGPLSSTFGLNKERYTVFLRIQSECGKIRTRKTQNTDNFHGVLDLFTINWHRNLKILRFLNIKTFNSQRSHRMCSLKHDAFKNFTKLTRNHLWHSLFFNKVAGWGLHLYEIRYSGTGAFLWILWNL